jgi:S-adenosylmethionine decarboxylase
MQGLHLTADLHGCAPDGAAMVDEAALRTLCLAEVQRAGLTPVAERFHAFGAGQGVTGVVLLAESHVAVHTWPELRGVTLDVYVCNFGADNTARARGLAEALVAAFAPARVQRHELARASAEAA